jgi:hypothetical protein
MEAATAAPSSVAPRLSLAGERTTRIVSLSYSASIQRNHKAQATTAAISMLPPA